MGRIGVLLVVVVAAGCAAVVALAAQSPKAVRTSILDAAKAQHSVHYVAHQVVGTAAMTLTGDVEAAAGIQHVSIHVGKKAGHLTILVADSTAYLKGDGLGLEFQGLTKAQASKYAGRWISIPKGDKSYGGEAAYVTLGSVVRLITPRGRLTTFRSKDHGTRVVGVRGVSGTGTKKQLRVLVARAHGKRLPLEEDELAPGQAYISRTALSKWNEPVQVQAPSSSTPISTVRGG